MFQGWCQRHWRLPLTQCMDLLAYRRLRMDLFWYRSIHNSSFVLIFFNCLPLAFRLYLSQAWLQNLINLVLSEAFLKVAAALTLRVFWRHFFHNSIWYMLFQFWFLNTSRWPWILETVRLGQSLRIFRKLAWRVRSCGPKFLGFCRRSSITTSLVLNFNRCYCFDLIKWRRLYLSFIVFRLLVFLVIIWPIEVFSYIVQIEFVQKSVKCDIFLF